MWFHKKKEKNPTPPPPTEEEVRMKVGFFISRKTNLIKEDQIEAGTKLFSSGLLDSLSFIQLVNFVETEFKIRLSDTTEVNLDTFDAFGSVVSCVVNGVSEKHARL